MVIRAELKTLYGMALDLDFVTSPFIHVSYFCLHDLQMRKVILHAFRPRREVSVWSNHRKKTRRITSWFSNDLSLIFCYRMFTFRYRNGNILLQNVSHKSFENHEVIWRVFFTVNNLKSSLRVFDFRGVGRGRSGGQKCRKRVGGGGGETDVT